MIEAAVANDVFLMEAYMYRCLPQTKLIAQLVRDGELGTVHQIQATFAFASSYRPESQIFADDLASGRNLAVRIGRELGRERGWQEVYISWGAFSLKKTK